MDIMARDVIDNRVILDELPHDFILVFDDGEIQSTKNMLIYSQFFWELHRQYQLTPIYIRHHVSSVLKGEKPNSNTYLELLSIIAKDVVIAHNLHKPEEKEHLWGLIYEVTNTIYNEVNYLSEPYVTTIDILDFLQVIRHPEIESTTNETKPTLESIEHLHKKTSKILLTDPSLDNNSLASAYRSKIVSKNQVLQCITVRGPITDVDGAYYPRPVMSNVTKGLTTLYDFAGESRSAAKSLYNSDSNLSNAEYFARRLQLLVMVVERIEYVDCGTDKYLNWRINPPTYNEKGEVVYHGDLHFMKGKYYLNEENNTLVEIKGDDPNLHNKTIKIRSVIYCKLSNPHNVCEVCFGGLSRNISRYANIGHLCTATLTNQSSQSILSLKHLDFGMSGNKIILTKEANKFFITNRKGNSYLIRKDIVNTISSIVVKKEDAFGLLDVLNVKDVKTISPIRITSIDYIDINYTDIGGETFTTLSLSQDNKKAILTTEFLHYLKIHKWTTNGKGNYVFSLKDWDCSKPIFKLPDMEYSFSDHSKMMATLIESTVGEAKKRIKSEAVTTTLEELFTLVNSKINVNMVALEVIIYALMIDGLDDFAMARNSEEPGLGVAAIVTKNRSLGIAYAYQDTHRTLVNPRNFFKLNRPDSLFDAFFMPKESLKYKK